MNITTRAQGFDLSIAIDTFVREQIYAALGRFSEDIISVDIFMKDTNGPRGGIDKQALILTQLRSRQSIAIETTHEDLYASIRSGAKRTKRAVRRSLSKGRRISKLRLRDLPAANDMMAVPKA